MFRSLSPSLKWILAFARRELLLLLVFGAITASLWIFVVLTQEVIENEHHGIDNRILVALRTPGDPGRPIGPGWVGEASLNISALGSAPVLTLFTLLVCGYLLLEKRSGAAGMLSFAALSGTALNMGLKALVGRERPQTVPHLAEISNWSYPSGHSMAAAIIYLTLAVVLAEMAPKHITKLYFLGAAFFLAFLVGLTRVIIGVHYPSDVLAGWTAGTAWAIICWLGAHWMNRRRSKPLERHVSAASERKA